MIYSSSNDNRKAISKFNHTASCVTIGRSHCSSFLANWRRRSYWSIGFRRRRRRFGSCSCVSRASIFIFWNFSIDQISFEYRIVSNFFFFFFLFFYSYIFIFFLFFLIKLSGSFEFVDCFVPDAHDSWLFFFFFFGKRFLCFFCCIAYHVDEF